MHKEAELFPIKIRKRGEVEKQRKSDNVIDKI